MKTYEEYKVSGVKWLGKVPKHWEICRFKDFISLQTQTSLSENKIGLENIECATGKFIETNSEFEGNGIAFDVGDVIYGKLRPYLKKVWLSTFNGNAVGDFFVFRAKNTNSASYIRYVMLSDGFTKEADGSTFGTKMPRVSSNFIMSMRYFLPPPFEQQAIADYLDAKTEKMDQMIAKAEKKIEYLGELKQSLITRAVTRGLNPNAPLKDSGVKWIGDIPRDWEIPRLNFVTSKIGSGSTPKGGSEVYVDEGVVFLRSQNVYNDGLRLNDVVHIVPSIHEQMKGTKVQVDDILFNITGASIGRCCRFTKGIGEANVNQHVCIVRPKNILPTFLMYCLQSFVGQTQLRQLLKGGNREGLSGESFKNFYVLLPSPNEQQQIATYLDIKCSKIDHIVATQKKKIAYLQELKQSLITNVVTGKIKGEFYQFNLSSCIRQQNSLTAQFVSFSLANLANIFYPPDFYNN